MRSFKRCLCTLYGEVQHGLNLIASDVDVFKDLFHCRALEILKNRLALLKTMSVKWPLVSKAAQGLSQVELARACENAVKHAILERRTSLGTA